MAKKPAGNPKCMLDPEFLATLEQVVREAARPKLLERDQRHRDSFALHHCEHCHANDPPASKDESSSVNECSLDTE